MSARRSAGESTIYQDDDGRWHGYVSMGRKENGKRDRRHVSGQKRADVVSKVRKLEAKRDAGLVLASGRAWTFGQWLDHWMENIAVGRVRPKTYQGYESKIRKHIRPALGHIQLDRLQPEHLDALYASTLAAGLSPGTVLVVHRIISRSLKVAHQRGRVARNVALLVDAPQASSKEVVPLSVDAARAVLEQARTRRNAARWSVALALGLRQGEVLGARWTHIDLEQGIWSVTSQQQSISYRHGCDDGDCGKNRARDCPARTGGLLEGKPKTERGKRRIGLPPQLLAELKAHRQAQLAERLAAGSAWQDFDRVFAQVNGKPILCGSDGRQWRQLLVDAKVPHARLHDARHTAASILLAQGISGRVVMEILGHSTIAVTQNIYGHVMPEAVAAATTAAADVLWGPAPGSKATKVAPRRSRKQPG